MVPPDDTESDPVPEESGTLVDRRLPPLFRRAWYSLNQAFRRRIAHLDLTPDQYTVLRNLFEAGPQGVTQSELASNMSSDPNTVASLVDRMERADLLHRQTDPDDRRARRLRLAPDGRKKFRLALSLANQLQREVLAPLSPTEAAYFFTVLDKIATACRNAAERESQT